MKLLLRHKVIEVEIDGEAIQVVEHQGSSAALETQERRDPCVRINVLEDLEKDGLVGGDVEFHGYPSFERFTCL